MISGAMEFVANPSVQATAAAQERQQLVEERADAGAAAKRSQQAAALAQQRSLELEARVQVGGKLAFAHPACKDCRRWHRHTRIAMLSRLQSLLHELDKVQSEARAATGRADAADADVKSCEQLLAAARVSCRTISCVHS